MTISAKIILDSINELGNRLTTFELVFPRFILPEVLTHRTMTKNTSSSRAVPSEKLIQQTIDNCAMPIEWGKNKKGMQADQEIDEESKTLAIKEWLLARDLAVQQTRKLLELKVHKQISNRCLETFLHTTMIMSATDYDNFFWLRVDKDAQPEIRVLATYMAQAYMQNKPQLLKQGQWHLPYITIAEKEKYEPTELVKFSVARCARVSYLLHDGQTTTPEKDIELHDRLVSSYHFSPTEHPATPLNENTYLGNFKGWKQYRKTLINEHRTNFDFSKIGKG